MLVVLQQLLAAAAALVGAVGGSAVPYVITQRPAKSTICPKLALSLAQPAFRTVPQEQQPTLALCQLFPLLLLLLLQLLLHLLLQLLFLLQLRLLLLLLVPHSQVSCVEGGSARDAARRLYRRRALLVLSH
jgi:hypothetical protein